MRPSIKLMWRILVAIVLDNDILWDLKIKQIFSDMHILIIQILNYEVNFEFTNNFFPVEANIHDDTMWIFAVYWEKYFESNTPLYIAMYKCISFNESERHPF